jgi:hypothetical protein
MEHFCYTYNKMQKGQKSSQWTKASEEAANWFKKGPYLAQNLHYWAHTFIKD